MFLYGFDDLTPLQRDTVETLARHADVCVALAYEPGRAAFAGRAATVELLKPLAERHELLHDRSEHYAPAARAALHHLERELFEPGAARRRAQRRGAAAGGGRRARRGRAGRRRGARADGRRRAAGGHRGARPRRRRDAEVLAQVLEAYGVPVSLDRRPPLAHTRLGAGVLAAPAPRCPAARPPTC